MLTLDQLTARYSAKGRVEWIGVRPERRKPMISVEEVMISNDGLIGDRYNHGGKRAVTLVQAEHLPVIAAFCGRDRVEPEQLRRNIVVSGVNLLAVKNSRFTLGDAVLEGTGICAPCSRMEETFGFGGYNAVRGHGGITARVIVPGKVHTSDILVPVQE